VSAPDVVVIGGGVVGTAAAAILAGEGARVTLYEREAIAAGASGRNSGVVQHPFDPPLVELYHRTVEVYRMLGAEAPDAGFVLADAPAGLLLLSRRPDGVVPALTAHLAARFPELAPRAVGDADLRALEPTLAPGLGACRIEAGFPVVPSAPTYALASLAERRGAVLRLGRSVAPAVESGRCVGVRVGGSNQVEPAGAVLVTAGPWSAQAIDPSNTWRPIRQVWGVVAETMMASPPRHVLEEAEMDEALGIGARGFIGDAPAPAADGPRFSLMTAAGRSVAGSTFLEGDQPELRPWVERILRHGAEFVPALADAPIREIRACARPVALDGRPLIGAVPGVTGLFVCAGHGPWGISTGPGSAAILADLVLGRAVEIDAAFDPGRFGPLPSA
jgi:glycine/D-amino acid oxidase-like deaminating enzyme